jgi:hypothetical protein
MFCWEKVISLEELGLILAFTYEDAYVLIVDKSTA